MGDTAQISQLTISGGRQSGQRNLIDLQENFPAETSTAEADGLHDFRTAPILKSADDPVTAKFKSASGNIEMLVALLVTKGQVFPSQKAYTAPSREADTAMDITVTQTSTTAATWSKSGAIGANNAQGVNFEKDSRYRICKMFSNGGASLKHVQLIIPGLIERPGICTAVSPQVQRIPIFDPFEYVPLELDGGDLNNSKFESIDIDGSLTPEFGIRVRKVA